MAKKISRIDIVENDPFKGIHDSAAKTETKIVVLKTALEAINAALEKNAKQAAKLKGGLGGIDPSSIKNQKEFNKAVQETSKLVKDNERATVSKARVTKALTIEEAKLKEAVRLANVESRQVARLKLAEEGSVKKLQAKLAILTREWDKLSKAERENTDRGKRLKLGIDQTTASVTKLEQATGRHQRNVGNYGSALDGLKGKFRSLIGFASQLGVALGGAFLVRESLSVLTEFDEKLADIAKTTGLTTQAAKELSIELFEIDTRTSITNLQQLLSAAGRLGIEGRENLLAFTEAADKVFVALGDDLEGTAEEIATNLGKIASVFGLEEEFGIGVAIEKVGSGINELSANSKASGGAIQDFTNRMAGLASVLELQDVQALGAFFDEAGQSIEVSASTLNKLLPDLSANYKKFATVAGMTPEAFKKIAEESPIDALKAVAVGAKSNEKGLFALTETLEAYGVESARATGIVGVLTNNVGRLTELQEINKKAIEDNTSITDEFNTKNDTLAATWEKLVKHVHSWVIMSGEGISLTTRLKDALAFLGTNLGTIISLLGKAVRAWIIYRTTLATINIATKAFGDDNGKLNFSLKQLKQNLTGAEGGLKGFGRALKGIGLTAVISLLLEVGLAFWDIASRAAAARRQTELYAKAAKEAAEDLERIRKSLTESRQAEVNAIRKLRAEGKISEDEEKRRIKIVLEGQRAIIKTKVEELRLIHARIKAAKEEQAIKLETLKAEVGFGTGLPIGIEEGKRLAIQQELVAQLNAKQRELRITIEGLVGDYKDLGQEVFDAGIEITETGKAIGETDEKAKEINTTFKNQIDLLRELTDQYDEYLDALGDVAEADNEALLEAKREELEIEKEILLARIASGEHLFEDLNSSELEGLINDRKELEIKAIEERRDFEIETLRTDSARRFAFMREDLAKERDELLKGAGENAAKRAEIERNYQEELRKIKMLELDAQQVIEEQEKAIRNDANNEIIKLERDAAQEIKDIAQEVSEAKTTFNLENEEALQKQLELESELRKKAFEEAKKWIELEEKMFTENIDKKIKQIEREMQAHKDAADYLKQLAAEGNIEAQQSIIEEERLANEALLKLEKLEERKRQIKAVAAFMQAYLNSLEQPNADGTAKTSSQALVDASVSTAFLEAGIAALPQFFEGADKVADVLGAPQLKGRDGHIIRVDGEERILNPSQNKAIGSMTNDEVVRRIQLSKIAEASGNIAPSGWESASLIAELSGVKSGLKEVKKAIEDKPELTIEAGKIIGNAFSIIETVTKAKRVTQNIYRIRP